VRVNKPGQEEKGWKVSGETEHYADDHLSVVTEEVQAPSRSQAKPWTIVRRKSAIVVAAITRDNKLLLVRQERIPIRMAIWEVPAGQIDQPNPDRAEIEATALRELREETAHVLADDGKLIPLGHFFASPGFTDEREYMFLARPVEPLPDGKIDQDEAIIEYRGFSIPEIQEMIAREEIRDANTLSICARLAARGLIKFDGQKMDHGAS
jgi:ADP-ribose pyrophosphatase